jgi:hypothetical protein
MERRACSRSRVKVTVYVTLPGRRRRCLRAKNLSSRGVFLETKGARLPTNIPLQLFFVLPNRCSSVIRVHCISAKAIRLGRGGVGMAFCRSQIPRIRPRTDPHEVLFRSE